MHNNSRYEVLNISNINSNGDTVLNDERLLEIVQFYPFLYSPDVRPFQDPDYEDWAWKRIAAEFNRSYQSLLPTLPFSAAELQLRWQILKPIIKSLSKACDMNMIPEALRQIVLKISRQLDEPNVLTKNDDYSNAQSIILDNIAMVERLPLAEQKRLEAEVMELILSSELSSKGISEISSAKMKSVTQECKDFLKLIDIDVSLPQSYAKTDKSPTKHINSGESDCKTIGKDKDMKLRIKNESLLLTTELNSPYIPPSNGRWIPLNQAHLHVRPCMVHIKRTCVEDYLPLSAIKRETVW